MGKLMHFDTINNNIDLKMCDYQSIDSLVAKFLGQKSEGGLSYNSILHYNAYKENQANKFSYMEDYLTYHNICKLKEFGFVYVIAGTHQGVTRYKIGKANSLKDRLKRFEVKIPFDIDVVISMRVNNPLMFESELHRMFKDNRLSGEWFDLSPIDIHKITRIGLKKETKDYIQALDEIIEEYEKRKKKERWKTDSEYIQYLEQMLVFNNIQFESRC